MGERNYNRILPDAVGLYQCIRDGGDATPVVVTRVNGVYMASGDDISCPVADLDGAYFYGPVAVNAGDVVIPELVGDDSALPASKKDEISASKKDAASLEYAE